MTVHLSAEERRAVDALRERLDADDPPGFALGGVFGAASTGSGQTAEAPEPDSRRIAVILTRLSGWLQAQGFVFQRATLDIIASAADPWLALRGQLKTAGANDATIENVEETVRNLHTEEWRLGYVTDSSRARGAVTGALVGRRDTPGAEVEDAGTYLGTLAELRALGLTESQAHEVLAEWGFQNPVYTTVDPQVEAAAQSLAVMRATGEYTGPVTPEQLLAVPTLESAMQLLEETSFSSIFPNFTDFSANLGAETGLGGSIEEAAQNVAAAEAGEPQLGGDIDQVTRRPIGVPEGFVSRAAPRPPGRLRGTPTRPGLDFADAEAVAATGGRGEDLAFAGRGAIAQDPEYFEGDNSNIFQGLGFEQTVLYQTMLVDAGWLDPEDFRIEQGQRNGGFATWAAMGTAMTAANTTIATSWIEAAQISAETRERNDAAAGGAREPVPVWTPGVYLKPDPDFLTQTVKGAFRSQLGREPTAQEVTALIGSLSSEYRSLFDVSEQADKIAFAQGIAAQDAALGPIDPATGERVAEPLAEGETFRTVTPGTEALTGVDPIASFQELFETRFADEMARGRQRVTQRDARSDIMSSIFAIDAAVGGGR